MTEKPLFPFGYGLSYSSFSIGKAKLSKKQISAKGSLKMVVPVTNKGKTPGTEVVQVYIKKLNDIDGPVKTLRAFKRVEVAAGKTVNAEIVLTPESFEFYDWTQRKMMTAPGDYEVYCGNSSDNDALKVYRLTIK